MVKPGRYCNFKGKVKRAQIYMKERNANGDKTGFPPVERKSIKSLQDRIYICIYTHISYLHLTKSCKITQSQQA